MYIDRAWGYWSRIAGKTIGRALVQSCARRRAIGRGIGLLLLWCHLLGYSLFVLWNWAVVCCTPSPPRPPPLSSLDVRAGAFTWDHFPSLSSILSLVSMSLLSFNSFISPPPLSVCLLLHPLVPTSCGDLRCLPCCSFLEPTDARQGRGAQGRRAARVRVPQHRLVGRTPGGILPLLRSRIGLQDQRGELLDTIHDQAVAWWWCVACMRVCV